MKKLLTTIIFVLLLSTGTWAAEPSILPFDQSTHYYGAHDFSFDLGIDGVISGRLEFAVYADSQAQDMIEWSGYQGEADFVYAYQVFCDSSGSDGLTYFALTGIDPTTIADVENDISEAETLDAASPVESEGVGPVSGDFNQDVTEAIWQFEEGTLVQGDQSWFLLLYSDSDWIAGDIEVRTAADDDIPVPDDDNSIPEPATLALLAWGSILCFRRRK